MAARKVRTKVSDDQAWVQRIKAAKLEERLIKHALGKVKMSATQVQAVKILLAKIRPDLKAIEASGPDGGPITVEVVQFGSGRKYGDAD